MSTAERKLSRREPPLPGQFYCKACRRYFQESDGSRAVHRRLFHQAVTQTTYYGEQEVHTFHRGPSGLFACLRCPFQHHDPRAFWDHVARQAGCPQTHAPNTDPTSLEELGVAVSELAGRLEPVLTGQEVGSVMERVEGTDRAEMAESLEAAQMDAEVAGTRTHLCQLEHVDTELVEAGEAVEVPKTDVDVPCAREDMQTSPKLVPSNSHDSLDLSALAPLPSPLIPRPRSLPAIPAAHKPIASGTLHTAESSQPGDIPIVEDFSSPAIPSLDDWPSFDPTECEITPGPDTVTHDDDHDLERYNLVINTQLRLIICIPCSKAVLPARLRRHLLDKWPRLDVPDDIGEKLRSKYNVAATHDWPFPQARILPVFGLPILPNPYLFCQSCHHGYSSHTSLASHHYQRTCARSSDQSPGHFIAYGQTVGFDPRVVFPVDTSLLATPVRRPAFSTEPFTTLPRPDYAHLPISKPVNSCNIDLFFKNEDFYSLVGSLTPEQVNQSIDCTAHTPEQKLMSTHLDIVSRTYCKSIQAAIIKSSAGLRRLMAQVGAESSREELRPLEDNSLNQYSAVLANLIYTMLRAHASDSQHLKFPLDPPQCEALTGLRSILIRAELPNEQLTAEFFHRTCFALFAQEKQHGGLDNWVLPVNRYVVARCMGRETWIKANEITRICAKLQWINRGVMLTEMNRRMPQHLISSDQAYQEVKKFLLANNDTPSAFIYDVHHTVRKIRDEYNDADVQMENESHTRLIFDGHRIDLHQFKTLAEALTRRHADILGEHIFFGRGVDQSCFPPFEIEDLVDNPHNFSPGFCFLDIPSNGFDKWAELYPRWLLSHPDLEARFTYVLNGQQRWKLHPTRQLLERFEELRLILAIRCIVSCGPSVRAAEFARQSLRNLPGGAARNVVLLYRTLCLLAVLEKTSMQFSRKHCTPHSPVPSVSKDLIWNLAVFRPFEQFLISQFKGPIDAERYFTSMWPGIDADFTSHLISTTLGNWTEQILGVRLQIIEYRKIVGTFCRYIVDPFLYKTLEDSLFDELQNHSTGMSYMRYGVEKQTLASSDPRKVVGCIKACRAWGAATGIDGGIPIKLELPPNLENQTVLLPHTAGTGSGDPPSALSLDTIQRAISETLRSDEFIKRESLEAPLTQIIASLAALYFPKVPEPPSANRLQPISSVVVHPSRRNALREFRGDETASWTCPHQAELLERMRDKKRHILAVLACNSGKTATILMQANIFDSASTTIFVLPVSGLHQDLHRRATQSRLNVARWKPDHAAFNADFNVLYVSVEDIRDEFIRFAKGLALTQRLANLVVDEAHIALTDANYREPIRRLIRLATEIEAHITLLSGSIGPQHETPLLDMFLLQNVDVIRMPSWRSNIEYLVSLHAAKTDQTGCKVETYVEAAVVYIKWRMKQTAGNCYRMIVYCRSVRVAEDAAKALGVVAYHAGVDMDARRRIFNNWLAGVDQVIVSTSILGAGIDTIVREVIQLDVAHTVIDSHQQANRAGRDNLPARVIVFASCKREPSLGEDHKASLGSVYLVPWLFHFVCRRLLFALFLDGVGVTCGVIPGAQYCDVCHLQSRQPAPRNAPPMPTASSQEELAALLPLLVTAQARREAILRAPDVKRLLYSGARHTVASSNTSARQANSLLEQDHPPRLRKIPRIEPRPVRHQPVSHPMTNDSPAFLPPPPLPPSMSPPWYLPPPSPHFGPPFHPPYPFVPPPPFFHNPPSIFPPPLPHHDPRPAASHLALYPSHPMEQPSSHAQQSSARSLDSSPASSLLPSHVKHEPAQFRGYENPPPPSSQPAGTRVDQPASVPGISVVIAQNEHVLRKKECIQICREVTAALDTILSKQGCAVCLIRQRIDWDAHSLDDCSANVATANDLRYQGWKGTAMKLPDGWCFHCMRPQGKIGSFQTHEWMEAAASRCAHAGVIKAMLYAFFTSAQGTPCLSSCALIPFQLRSSDHFGSLCHWVTDDARDYSGLKIKNHLVLFRWLIKHTSKIL